MRPRVGDLILTQIASRVLPRAIHGLGVVTIVHEWTGISGVSCYYVKGAREPFEHLIYNHEITRVIR